ncbi:ABC transporter ATP-binding protein [Prevotella sp. PINT]|jgi:ABC-type bacteriocin/lantibiotic exporters, contain an N-terminal double-glycine peptidase domain|uniref:ABC transporter ATP-binding protein n=1 Tax=Palleniella intestinalis TaxID=2736291 RepID=UPI001555F409|nr:ABC transporter ATP-binding protein [Palleniella intestinalis]NPD82409.1 ABC transporter ATP-binding protein [Palleniella intestinalis]
MYHKELTEYPIMHNTKAILQDFTFLYRNFRGQILINKKYFFIGVLMVLCAGLSQVSLSYLIGALIDVLSGRNTEISIQLSFCMLFTVFLLNTLFNLIKNYCFLMFAETTTVEISQMLFSRILRFPLSFFEQTQAGGLSSRLSNDVQSLKRLCSEQIAQLLFHPLIIVFCLCNLFVISFRLTLLLILTFPLILRTSIILGGKIKKTSKETYNCYAAANQIRAEDFILIRLIKSCCGEEHEENRYNKVMSEIRKKSLSASFTGILLQFVISCLLLTGLFLIMLYAIYLIQQSEMTTGRLFEFIMCTIFIVNAISSISSIFASVMNTLGVIKTFRELLTTKEEKYTGNPVSNDFHEILLNNVFFTYKSRTEPVLSDISLAIHAGDRIGIIGESGGGKSTLVQLLLRYYQPTSGNILLNGIDVATFNLQDYRSMFGVVSQNIELFSGSIKENIMYPNTDVLDEEIIAAAHYACAHDFIKSLPDGYDTIIGENGINLSGGQRQRITIARALVRNPKIIILDEATSALDQETEQCINEFLSEISRDTTLIVLSHRMSIIRQMDKVYEINNKAIIKRK